MLISCPECGKQISDQAASCPHCGRPMRRAAPTAYAPRSAGQAAKRKEGPRPFLIFLLIMGVIMLVYFMFSGGGNSGSKKSYSEADYKSATYTLAEQQVKKYLKAPSTATFCKMSETSFSKDESDTYVMTGWVDAENSYGATLRTSWGIKVKVSVDKITMQKLIIGSETVYP